MGTTYASIDIGTNTITILVVKIVGAEIEILYENEFITMLGDKLVNTNKIQKDALSRCKTALISCKKIIEEYKVANTFCVATSALRQANNQEYVLSEINKCGFHPAVISGNQEAIFVGNSVLYEFSDHLNNAVVVDIGGGSTEFIFIKDKIIEDVKSINLGTVSLTDLFKKSDPMMTSEITSCNNYITSILNECNFSLENVDTIIGVGGTVTTLCAIFNRIHPYDATKIHKGVISRNSLIQLENKLLFRDLNYRKYIPGLHPLRAEVIPVGLLILSSIIDFFSLHQLTVCDRGLRWGVLWKNIEENI